MLKIFLFLTIAQAVSIADASTAKAAAERTSMISVQKQLEVLPAARQTAINALLESIKESQEPDGLTPLYKGHLHTAVGILVDLYAYYSNEVNSKRTLFTDQLAAVTACNHESAGEFDSMAGELEALDTTHSDCRGEEKGLWDNHLNSCQQFYIFLKDQARAFHPAGSPMENCKPVDAPEYQDDVVNHDDWHPILKGETHDAAADWKSQVSSAQDYFETEHGRYVDLVTPCTDAFALAKAKNTACKSAQTVFQQTYCNRKIERHAICSSRESCHQTQLAISNTQRTEFSAFSDDIIHIVKVLKKAVCYLRVIANGTDPALDNGVSHEIQDITPDELANTYCPDADVNSPDFDTYRINFGTPDAQADCPIAPFDADTWAAFHTRYFDDIQLWTAHSGHQSAVWNDDVDCPNWVSH